MLSLKFRIRDRVQMIPGIGSGGAGIIFKPSEDFDWVVYSDSDKKYYSCRESELILLSRRNDMLDMPVQHYKRKFGPITIRMIRLFIDNKMNDWLTLWFIGIFGFDFGIHLPKCFYKQKLDD